jgi:hypothetical protein
MPWSGGTPAVWSFDFARARRYENGMEIVSALSSANTALELAHTLQNGLARGQAKPVEFPARLMEFQEHLLSMQEVVHDLPEENRKLTEQISELQRSADFGKEFVFEEGVYWYRKYPYCANCWDVERKPVQLAGPYATMTDTGTLWHCPNNPR